VGHLFARYGSRFGAYRQEILSSGMAFSCGAVPASTFFFRGVGVYGGWVVAFWLAVLSSCVIALVFFLTAFISERRNPVPSPLIP